MFPVPEASYPAVEICSERSAAGVDLLRVLHIEVRKKDHLEHAVDAVIAVDHVRYTVDQLDDELCDPVSGRGLSAEDDGAGAARPLRLV